MRSNNPSSPDRRIAMSYRPPLDADALLGFFARRAVAGVEEVDDGAYRRSLRLAGGPAVVELRPLDAVVEARLWLADERDEDAAVKACRSLFDLDCDPAAVHSVLGADPLLRAAPGLRVPGHPDPHELAVRAVLGQQVSLAGAATLAGRLVAAHGEPLAQPRGGVTRLFPAAAALAAVDSETLAMPRARRAALLGLARALARGEVELTDPQDARRDLLALPGIGPWTAEYVAMRALGDRDAFLSSDLGVRHALERRGEDGRPAAATRLAERWRPYRAYAVLNLWAQLGA